MKLPAVLNSTVADAPGWMVPASNAPVDDVAVCCWGSLLVHITDPPTGTCTSAGPNLNWAIPTALAPAAAEPAADVATTVSATTGATVVTVVGAAVVIEVATDGVVALLELSLEQAPMMGSAKARRANRCLIAPFFGAVSEADWNIFRTPIFGQRCRPRRMRFDGYWAWELATL